ncbi:MAG: hypothetical protein A2Y48_07985 [Nitrospirae bacterium RIFCSPLOW2_12_42_9]|nr:MAG: hypothetical protein A2Y48_07985 [Nitrospirae bacterium RIFCSPLOW2_12_42_9]
MKRLRHIMILTAIFISICNTPLVHGAEKSVESYTELTASELDAFIERMTVNLQSVKNLKSEFIQERHLSMFLDVLSAKGSLYFETQDKLRWELKEPYSSILIFNGGYIAKFNLENGKYVRMNLGMEDMFRESLRQILSIMRWDFKKVREDYKITILKGGDYNLVMRPVSTGMARIIKSLVLSIDPKSNYITKIIINEPHGDYIEIRFSGQEENRSFNQHLFDINNPLTQHHSESTLNKSK